MNVYLDTSVILSLFDEMNPERKLLAESFFKKIENFEIFISEITFAEIERTPDIELRDKMKRFIRMKSEKYKIKIEK
jgi:predicted nucleic acid-binding protein